jgi:tripartite-type tricarboxylate transporter receptor subunit TctC
MIGRRTFSCAALAASWPGSLAWAQAESSPPTLIVVPFPAGGVVDRVARLVADPLQQLSHRPVVIENRVGAGGAIGTETVARAAPDGRTMACVGMPAFMINALTLKSARWHPVRDFRAVAGVRGSPYIIAANREFPARHLIDVVSRAPSAALRYGTAGVGTGGHLIGTWFAQLAGVKMVHVPYKGQPDALKDLLAGETDMAVLTADQFLPHVGSGRVKLLGVTSATRWGGAPEVPSIAEVLDVPEFVGNFWTAFIVRRQVPEAICARWAADFASVIGLPEVQARLKALGLDAAVISAEETDRSFEREMPKWASAVLAAGLKAD